MGWGQRSRSQCSSWLQCPFSRSPRCVRGSPVPPPRTGRLSALPSTRSWQRSSAVPAQSWLHLCSPHGVVLRMKAVGLGPWTPGSSASSANPHPWAVSSEIIGGQDPPLGPLAGCIEWGDPRARASSVGCVLGCWSQLPPPQSWAQLGPKLMPPYSLSPARSQDPAEYQVAFRTPCVGGSP